MSPFSITREARFCAIQFVMVILLCGCISPRNTNAINQMFFRTVGRIPVVEGKINGKCAYFIVDTGASVSILNQSVSDHFGFNYIVKVDQNILGLGGQARLNEATNCNVEFGSLKLNGIVFCTKPLSDFVAFIRQRENITVAGIIGADVFTRYNITIDFKTQMISF